MNVEKRKQRDGSLSEWYYGRFEWRGKAYLRCLGTSDRRDAEARLKALRKQIMDGDLAQADSRRLRNSYCTLGEIFLAYRAKGVAAESTRRANILAMRALIRGSMPELAQASNEAIDKQPASLLTARLIIDYQANTQAAAAKDPVAGNRAATSANSYRRQARSLFARDNLTIYRDLKLPDLADFLGARKLREPRHDFVRLDGALVQRIMAAAPALRAADPNAYRVLVMALGMGLRKREIAFSQWDWLQHEEGGMLTLVLRCTDRFRTKNNQPRAVPVPLAVYNELVVMRQAQANPAGPHFLEGCETARLSSFGRFARWLKAMGWTRIKKAHELRKMFGTEIHAQAGLAAAQKLLGHSAVGVTLAHYVDIPNVSVDVLTKFLPHLRAPASE